MNTYNDNLQATVNKTLADLLAQQTQLKSTKVATGYKLYYAQATQLSTRHTVQDLVKVQRLFGTVNDQSVLSEIAINNLLQSATMANTNVGASTTNMATAASNVKIAANAIAALSAEIGSAFNYADSSLYNTDVHLQVSNANDFIKDVANDAMEVSRRAMNASSKTSEVVAQAVLQQVTDVKAKIDGLLKITQAALDTTSTQATAAKAAAAQAVQVEQQAEGAVRDIRSQVKANRSAYKRTCTQLNLGLEVNVYDAKNIGVQFTGLSSLLPTFTAKPASLIDIPPADPTYYLALLPSDQMSTFSVEQAQQLFIRKTGEQFHAIDPTGNDYTPVALTIDVFKNEVKPGSAYVAYLYVELSPQYRRFINDFSDILSSPSMPFTPATTLPRAQEIHAGAAEPSAAEGVLETLQFSAGRLSPDPKGLEFRCILVESDAANDLGFLTSLEHEKAHIYFNLDIASQVAPANYEKAERGVANKPRKKKSGDTTPVADHAEEASVSVIEHGSDYYTVAVRATTTDNFGNLLRNGVSYKPYILTLINSDENEDSNAYTPVLSHQLPELVWTHDLSFAR